jgi:acyl-coenzyme A synthetase/AMP-(fatty) acid ligase
MQVYVLDRNFDPVPAGIDGELYLGGDGLARGYLGRPAETAERFVPNPFRNGERLFRTGDLAHWRSDGELEFVGRVDQQVKIRGYRIELGEIESALMELEQVKDAVVVAREDMQGEKRLVAYVIPRETLPAVHSEAHGAGVPREQELGVHLREALRHFLPGYMVPSVVLALDALPLSPNGKVDRAPCGAEIVRDTAARVAPRTIGSPQLAGRNSWSWKIASRQLLRAAGLLLATRVINVSGRPTTSSFPCRCCEDTAGSGIWHAESELPDSEVMVRP